MTSINQLKRQFKLTEEEATKLFREGELWKVNSKIDPTSGDVNVTMKVISRDGVSRYRQHLNRFI